MTPTMTRDELLGKVKIGEFIRRGIELTGVVHVGAHDGYEVGWYLKLGLRVIAIEPLPAAADKLRRDFPNVHIFECALSDYEGIGELLIPKGDGQGASLLKNVTQNPEYPIVATKTVKVQRACDMFFGYDIGCDCLVVDAEGMELRILQGFGRLLSQFKALNIECSRVPIYKGQAPASEVIAYLATEGFAQLTPTEDHNDILFVRRGLMPTRYNLGSGQCPFPKPWINVDAQAKWEPDIVGDAAKLDMVPYGEAEIVVLHHVAEHYGCGDSLGLIQECYRILKPQGSLLVFVPDMRALARVYDRREMTTQIYMTNVYGAWMGDEADRHKWGFDAESLTAFLSISAPWTQVKRFDWRPIEGATLAKDFWILAMECVK